MLTLVVLWIVGPLLMIAFGAAACFAIAIIVEGVRGIFGAKS
jgi:hypothetical protein